MLASPSIIRSSTSNCLVKLLNTPEHNRLLAIFSPTCKRLENPCAKRIRIENPTIEEDMRNSHGLISHCGVLSVILQKGRDVSRDRRVTCILKPQLLKPACFLVERTIGSTNHWEKPIYQRFDNRLLLQ